jgi:spore germination protein KB
MLENGKISPLQFGILIFLFSLGTPIIRMPGSLASVSKQDSWITLLLGMGISVGIVFIYNRLAERFPNETVVEYSERILGKWLGKMVSISFIWYFLYLCAFGLRGVGDFLTTAILVQTPIDVIHIVFMVGIVYGAKLGLEVIGRTGEVLFPWVIGLSILVSIFLLSKVEFSNFSPILPVGWNQPAKGLYYLAGTPITQLVVFLMIFPFVNRHKQAKKWFYAGILFNLLYLLLLVVVSVSVLGADQSARSLYATYDAVKQVMLGDFVERIEAFIAGVWFITIFIKLILLLYVANLAIAQVFKFKSYRPFVLPSAMMVLALALILGPNIAYLRSAVNEMWPAYSIIQGLLIPVVLLLVAMVRKLRHQ